MPLHLRTLAGKVPYDVEQMIRELVDAVNLLEARSRPTDADRATDPAGQSAAIISLQRQVLQLQNKQVETEATTPPGGGGGGGGGGAPAAATYLTAADETATLPNSRQHLAGDNIAFDDATPGQRTVRVDPQPSAGSKLLGRGDSGAGSWEEISLGTGLMMTGTTLAAPAGGGDVVGPASAGDGNVVLFDGVTGKLIKDGGTPVAFISGTGYWAPVTNGNPAAPELLFDSFGDLVVAFTPTP